MSYDDGYTQPPSGTFGRSDSIDYSNHDEYANQTSGPSFTSLGGIKETEYHYPTDVQRSRKSAEVVVAPPPQPDEVRPAAYSGTLISNDTRHRGLDHYNNNDQPLGREDLGRKNPSGYGIGDIILEESAPSQSVLAQRERSTNGTEPAYTESVDPLDYVGISLVGRRFKMVNPEAYYVEKDDDLTGYPATAPY